MVPTMPNPVPLAPPPQPMFVTWNVDDEQGRAVAVAAASGAYGRANATAATYRNVGGTNVSVRDGFAREDYDFFRPGERIPTRDRDIIAACMQCYEKFPEVHNIVDLMGDFAVKGIDVVHPRERVEKFGKEWFARVSGPERSERILNMLYRAGNVIVKRQTARLPDTTLDVLRAQAGDLPIEPDPTFDIPANEIPFGYTVLDPRWVEVLGGELAPLVGKQSIRYGVRIPSSLARRIKSPKGYDRELVSSLPVAVVNGAISEGRIVPLPPNKVAAIHYKKDDFQVWARPLVYPLLDHLQLYSKLMMADRAALDGVINQVRLWRLGSLEHRIYPTAAAVQRLADMLLNNTGGGVLDLIWGQELELQQTESNAHNVLGAEKYVSVLQAIYAGLGVPPSLTGMAPEGGFTNNFMGLKVLVERLEYGRMLLTAFWMAELEMVRTRMGFREPFTLVFDDASLSDEAAMLKLLLDLSDRDLVSAEFVQERFGAIPEIERVRLQRETKRRKAGQMPPKAGPFHLDSQQKATLERSFVQQGHATPDQVGLDMPPPKDGAKTPFQLAGEQKLKEQADKAAQVANRPKPKKRNGRPTGAKDTGKRKKKRVLPRTKAGELAEAQVWATEALKKIETHAKAAFVAAKGCDNLRQLTDEQAAEFEAVKFALLCRFGVGDAVTKASVRDALGAGPLSLPDPVADLYRATASRHAEKEGCDPSVEKARQLRAAVYALYTTDLGDDPSD